MKKVIYSFIFIVLVSSCQKEEIILPQTKKNSDTVSIVKLHLSKSKKVKRKIKKKKKLRINYYLCLWIK
jgi:hypothetical protein